MGRVKFEDMDELRQRVIDLLDKDRVVIRWSHIRVRHEVGGHEIRAALRYGAPLKPDKEVEGRYVVWSRLTEAGRLIRVVFEIREVNGGLVVVVTAFKEESR